jgi:hypothetical protein
LKIGNRKDEFKRIREKRRKLICGIGRNAKFSAMDKIASHENAVPNNIMHSRQLLLQHFSERIVSRKYFGSQVQCPYPSQGVEELVSAFPNSTVFFRLPYHLTFQILDKRVGGFSARLAETVIP